MPGHIVTNTPGYTFDNHNVAEIKGEKNLPSGRPQRTTSLLGYFPTPTLVTAPPGNNCSVRRRPVAQSLTDITLLQITNFRFPVKLYEPHFSHFSISKQCKNNLLPLIMPATGPWIVLREGKFSTGGKGDGHDIGLKPVMYFL